MNRTDNHPDWCARGHVCSIDRPSGEHRSNPAVIDTTTGRILATRTRSHTGRDRLELRAVVDLPANPYAGLVRARQLIVAVHRAVHHPATVAAGGAP